MLERLTGVDDVVVNPQLLTDSSGVDETFGTASAFPTHEPEGQAFDMPAGFNQKRCRQ